MWFWYEKPRHSKTARGFRKIEGLFYVVGYGIIRLYGGFIRYAMRDCADGRGEFIFVEVENE